ncbi:hypothetical protein MMC17_001058 [Xylographa soralifera]|nr:hypothetical protein [Xylographa soralifera]
MHVKPAIRAKFDVSPPRKAGRAITVSQEIFHVSFCHDIGVVRPPTQSIAPSHTNTDATPIATHNSGMGRLSPTPEDMVRKRTAGNNASNNNASSDWNLTSATTHFPRRSNTTPLSDQDFIISEFPMENSFGLQASGSERSFPDMTNGAFPTTHLGELSEPTRLALDIPTPPWSTTPHYPSDLSNSQDEQCREEEFASLLEHCAKLQRHLRQTRDTVPYSVACTPTTTTTTMIPTLSNSQLEEMLGDIDATCNVMFRMYGGGFLAKSLAQRRGDLDCASASLTAATILKSFRVCDSLFDCNVLRNHGLNDILLQKRLDFNITQVRVVISRIEQLTQSGLLISRDITEMAMYIENRFNQSTSIEIYIQGQGLVTEPVLVCARSALVTAKTG